MSSDCSDPPYWMRVIFVLNRETLMELGIAPIATTGMIMQLLVIAKVLDVDFSLKDERVLLSGAQKLSTGDLAISALASPFSYHPAYRRCAYLEISCQMIYRRTDGGRDIEEWRRGRCAEGMGPWCSRARGTSGVRGHLAPRLSFRRYGYGYGSGINFFIAKSIYESTVRKAFSPTPVDVVRGLEFEGAILALLHLLFTWSDPRRVLREAFWRWRLPSPGDPCDPSPLSYLRHVGGLRSSSLTTYLLTNAADPSIVLLKRPDLVPSYMTEPGPERDVHRSAVPDLEQGGIAPPEDAPPGNPVEDPQEPDLPRTFKVTVWRAMNSIVILGFGVTKAVLAFRDNPSADAFDVALGLIWALIAYWCGILEAEHPTIAPWLFEVDVKEPLTSLIGLVLEENVFLVLCLVGAGIAVYARIVETVILVLIYVLIFVGVIGLALPAILWFSFVFAYPNRGRWWRRFPLSTAISLNGWWNVLHHIRAMDGQERKRMPYIICIASLTIFVHPFPLTERMPPVLAVVLVNVLVFVGAFLATRFSLVVWRGARRRIQESGGVWNWVRDNVGTLPARTRARFRSAAAARASNGANEGVEITNTVESDDLALCAFISILGEKGIAILGDNSLRYFGAQKWGIPVNRRRQVQALIDRFSAYLA
ncbi:hypothetical protein NMY22_g696 [Coprinellus aureogranulatus]|nr:hypothetical protein NMY22_g696 [Coprinellus aureogranulatus]